MEIYAHLDMTQNRYVQRSVEDLKEFWVLCFLYFIATKADDKLYVQVTESMASEDVRRRELAPLQKIDDNYEKIVLSLDPGLDASYDGIKSLNLINWLL